jgi:nicotinamidase-related amidase
MNTVVSLWDFKEQGRELPTLVLVDMHCDGLVEEDPAAVAQDGPLANCRAALRHARVCGMPVAFTRQVVSPRSMLASPAYPRWIEGFEPNRRDMIFDRQRPSCYASAEFRKLADDSLGQYVVAGRFGEMACLSTAVDASHRGHRPSFLLDALTHRAHEKVSVSDMRRATACILPLYVNTTNTQTWIRTASRHAEAAT